MNNIWVGAWLGLIFVIIYTLLVIHDAPKPEVKVIERETDRVVYSQPSCVKIISDHFYGCSVNNTFEQIVNEESLDFNPKLNNTKYPFNHLCGYTTFWDTCNNMTFSKVLYTVEARENG